MVIALDSRSMEPEEPSMEFDFAFQNSTYSLFVGLWKQAASTVINRVILKILLTLCSQRQLSLQDSSGLLVIPERFLIKDIAYPNYRVDCYDIWFGKKFDNISSVSLVE